MITIYLVQSQKYANYFAIFYLIITLISINLYSAYGSSEINCYNYQDCKGQIENCTDTSYGYCYGFESCLSADFVGDVELYAHGALSLIEGTVKSISLQLECSGFASCSFTSKSIMDRYLEFYGSFSGAWSNEMGVLAPADVSPFISCYGSHSCSNSIIKSESSYDSSDNSNNRSFVIKAYGIFSLYNTSIFSNGNNIGIYLGGYYAGYGSIINCTSEYDTCTIHCYGNGCVNMSLICPKSTSFSTDSCTISSDDSRTYTDIENDVMFSMIQSVIKSYDANYSLTPNGGIYYVDTDDDDDIYSLMERDYVDCNVIAKDYSQYDSYSITFSSTVNYICCLGYSACANLNASADSHTPTDIQVKIFCDATYACQNARIVNSSNIYVRATHGALYATFNNTKSMICEASKACTNMTASDIGLIVCVGSKACSYSKLSNVDVIIGLGYKSLSYGTISNVKQVYLLGYNAGIYLDVINSSHGVFYCQNGGCNDIKTNFSNCVESDYDSNVEICFVSPITAPTRYPTRYPTSYPTSYPTVFPAIVKDTIIPTIDPTNTATGINTTINSTIDETTYVQDGESISTLEKSVNTFLSLLRSGIVMVCVSLSVTCVILILLSKKYHKQRIKHAKHKTETELAEYLKIANQNGEKLEKPQRSKSMGNEMNKSQHISGARDKYTRSIFVNYMKGFGKRAQHSVIGFVGLEIYDIYTDIAYLMLLQSYQYDTLFVIFLSSWIISIIFNIFLACYVLKHEFSHNKLFLNWFYENNSITIGIIVFLSISDIGILTSLLTSQIFGHSAFLSPISMRSVNNVQMSSIVSVFIEHIPQVVIQIYLLFYIDKEFDSIEIASLIVSIIDIIFAATRGIVWIIISKQNLKTTLNK